MPPHTPLPVLRLVLALGFGGAALLLMLALGRIAGWPERAPVEGWMTPRFVMLAHRLTEADLRAILGPEDIGPGRTLATIAADRGLDPAAVVARVEAAALARAGAAE